MVMISDVPFDPDLSPLDRFADCRLADGTIDLDDLRNQARERAAVWHDRQQPISRMEQVMSILAASAPSATSDTHIVDPAIGARLRKAIARDTPIALHLSLFPCKGRHPLRTFAKTGAEVDLGEVTTLLTLAEMLDRLAFIHPPGARLHLLSNGRRYENVFHEWDSDVEGYRANIRHLVEVTGLASRIIFENEEDYYTDTYYRLLPAEIDCSQREIDAHPERHCAIYRSVLLNLQLPPDITIEQATRIFCCLLGHATVELSDREREIQQYLIDSVRPATARYIAVNRALARSRVFEDALPDSIKLTVHPKRGQIGFIPVPDSSVFPHNGQAVRGHDGSVRIDLAVNILRRHDRRTVRGLALSPNDYPFATAGHPFFITTARDRD